MKRILMVLSLMPLMAFATTWYVDGTTGADENSGTSPAEAKATIQAAIDASSDNDTILVAPGTYEPIVATNKIVAVESISGALTTVIDGREKMQCANLGAQPMLRNSVIVFDPDTLTTNHTKLIGFTLKDGCGDTAAIHGGEMRCCIVKNCKAMTKVAGCCLASNCLIIDNVSEWNILMHGFMDNCTIVNNRAPRILWDNRLRNGVLYGNSGSVYCNMDEMKCYSCLSDIMLPDGGGNIIANPHFVDAANGDYRLASDSPCIDAGNNSYVVGERDLDGSGRIVNGKVDIGCYEYGSVGGPYVEKVGETNWTYMIKNGKASVGDGSNAALDKAIAGAVNVPTELRGRPVVAIDDNAFNGCTELTSVTIPASVKTIGARAFEGCDKLADVYFEGDTLSSIGVDAFRGCYWDLIMHVPTTWQGRGRTICGYSVWKGDDPNETVRVVSTNVVVHYMTTNVSVEVVAPISSDTGIVNVMTEMKGGNVAIPDSWAKGFPTFEEKFGSNFTDALTRQTGKYDCNNTPMLVWQDYVAGTDPTNPEDTFTATITMVGGVPQVQWNPVLTDEAAEKRTYRKFGKVKLTDEWAEIPSGHEADYNFFKVSVEMK